MRINRDLFWLTLLYLAGHIWLLSNNGIFWDDWLIYNTSPDIIINKYNQMGLPFLGYFHCLLTKYGGIIAYRVLTLISYWLAGVCLYFVLYKTTNIKRAARMFMVLAFLLFPVNGARIAMINSFYAVSYAIFFVAVLLQVRYLETGKNLLRIFVLALFFLSFFTNSLLVFYYLTVLILYRHIPPMDGVGARIRRIVRLYPDFLLLPLFFWLLKRMFFMPYYLFYGYNEISLWDVLHAFYPEELFKTLGASFFGVVWDSVAATPWLMLTSVLIGVWVRKRQKASGEESDFSALSKGLLFGIAAFWLAVIPYLAASHIPHQYDWHSRNQLLVPLGAAFILCYGLWNANLIIRKLIYAGLIISFISLNFQVYLAYQVDWYKQMAILHHLSKNSIVREHTTFLVRDLATPLNAQRRNVRFYEYSGMMKMVFGQETRFATDVSMFRGMGELTGYLQIRELRQEYNLADYQLREPEYLIIIRQGTVTPKLPEIIKMRYYESFAPERLATIIDSMVLLETQKL